MAQKRIEDTPIPTRFSDVELEMIEEIRRHFDLSTRSAAIRYAVHFMHTALEEMPHESGD